MLLFDWTMLPFKPLFTDGAVMRFLALSAAQKVESHGSNPVNDKEIYEGSATMSSKYN